MTRKKSNVKALALAVTCAILAGGGIGLEPVYAADVLYKEAGGNVTTANKSSETDNTVINELTVGGVKIGSEDSFTGISIGSNSTSNHVIISDNDILASGAVHASVISSGLDALMEGGKLVAKNGLYIGATDIANPTNENSKFYVSGENGNVVSRGIVYAKGLNVAAGRFTVDSSDGSFKAANGKFNVSNSGAITADSLTLSTDYNVKQNIEAAKDRITAVEGDLNTNKADLIALQGRVNGHDTDINTLKTKTEGITRVDGNSTTVDGVNFNGGAVSGVTSINNTHVGGVILSDGTIEAASGKFKVYDNGAMDASGGAFKVSSAGAIKALGIQTHSNGSITLNDKLFLNAEDASLQDKAAGKAVSVAEMANTRDNTNKISYNDTEGTKIDSDVIINAGKKNQVKITEGEGIVVGLNSSVINDDGVFAGGHDYNSAKAALNASDGSIKGANGKFAVDENGAVSAADGAFGVDKDGNVKTDGNIQGNNITATGVLKGASLDVTGNATVGGTLDVTGKTTLKNELQVNEKATFGSASGSQTFINGDEVKTGRIETTKTQSSYIGGVTLHNGQITADSMTINGNIDLENLNVKETLTVGAFGVTKAGVVTGVTSINSVDVSNQGAGLKIGSATVGDSNPFRSQGYTVDATGNVSAKDITAGKYNGNEITADKKFNGVELNGGNVKATNVTADTITGGNVTAKNIQADTGTIAGVNFVTGGSVSGINELTAKIIKDGAGTTITGGNVESKTATIGAIKIVNETIESSAVDGLSIENVKINNGAVSGVTSLTANSATIGGVNKLDNTGITVNADKSIVLGTSKITNGKVEVSTNTSLANEALVLNETNKWTQAGGLVADKATVNGIALGTDSKGKATFTDANGKITTIDGDKITTGTITADKLLIDKISLGRDGNDNISIDKNGDVTTKGDVTVTGADSDTTVIDGAKATFGKDAANQTVIDKGAISANAKNINGQQAGLTFDENGLTVNGQNKGGKISSFSFNANTGISTFTGQDRTTTTINGSAITSTKADGNTGVLDGSNLTLTNGANKTVMTAGGVTFTGKQGASTKKYNTTTIDGGIITTDTLKVQRIQLGEKIVDERTGQEIGSGVTLAADGGFTAAGGNFKVVGGATGSRGSITNVVGDDNSGKTVFETNQQGANMSFKKGDVKSEVAVADGKAEMAVGANAAVTTTDGKVEIKGGTQTVTTTDAGTVFDNGSSAVRPGGVTTTTINGNEITTGKITTDQLVITGQGNAHGNGSIAFGGNGTIKSDINDGTTNGKNTSFETTLDGVNTKVTNGTTTTENKVTAEGNSNTVKQDDTHKSEFKQGLTSIGGVVTNGEIKVAQKLDGATGLLTNEVTDANGSSKLEQSGTGLTYTDSANAGNATRIDSSDVSIGSATEPDKRINLSDLGQIDELDKELTGRDEYKNNPTAVGGINAEAAIRREEVARLDGRINDVNDRVNKVGAMAAAIASLKSIGYDPQAPSEFSIGLGQYKGETGVAMGFFHYPNKNFMINVSLSTAGGETMGGIGATWRFGHKSPQKLLEEQREAQAKKELAAAEKYQAAAKLAKEAQERAEYAAKLARQAQVSADNAKAAADATQAKHFG
ncbi:YadA-like family protein [uncultured Phascolarctobacterium sp.]|uniref:YadA-like family protein n=1 Tax=uncultured Phascolarctobacterium sp. TaxID=512296 RepID=UPI0025CFFA7E|nr:YadA-like family protein [uncultured Phascolarctobacterium sp.]